MTTPKNSLTKTTETGAYYRTTIRQGNKKVTKTIKIKKNDLKVVFGKLGEFEVYSYPYAYPTTVFIGKFPISTPIQDWRVFMSMGMKIKHYLGGDYFEKAQNHRKKGKGANALTEAVNSSYNLGLSQSEKPKTGSKIHNSINTIKTEKKPKKKVEEFEPDTNF